MLALSARPRIEVFLNGKVPLRRLGAMVLVAELRDAGSGRLKTGDRLRTTMRLRGRLGRNLKGGEPRKEMVIGEGPGDSGAPPDVNLEIVQVSAAITADHTLRLLGCIAGDSRGTTVADLSRQLALPRSVTERICSGLLALGYVSRDLVQDRYVQGPNLRRLAMNALSGRELSAQRRGVLADLVTEVGETSNFTALDGASVLYLDRVEAAWPWRLTLQAGAKVPLHCTASGKLFLAYMAEARREHFLVQTCREPLTPATIVSAEALRRECDEITKRGYALDCEEFVPGLTAIAVPVKDATGKVLGAISVHGPSARMPVTEAVARLPALLGAAKRMADLL